MRFWLVVLFFASWLSGCHLVDRPPVQPLPVRILFGGDIQLDRYIRQQIDRFGPSFPLEPLHYHLITYDTVIANLEGPVTSYASRSVGSAFGSRENYIFTFPAESGQLLARENIKVVNLGNNHIGNFGPEGIKQTRANLDRDQVRYFGNTGDNHPSRFTIFTIRGFDVGLVNYNQFASGGLAAAMADLDQIRPVADVVVVYTHWGDEYQSQASASIQKTARQFIDRGADLVIGSHPHVVQPEETYRGKQIFYSLGNFVFDQYFRPESQAGILVEVVIDPVTVNITTRTIPIRLLPNGQTIFPDAPKE